MKSANSEHIAALLERISRLLTAEARAEGLLPVHWEALRYLDRANRFSCNAAALTAYLGLTKGTVSQTVGALQSKGLVRKTVVRSDRRSKHLSLTAKGKSVVARDPVASTIETIATLDDSTRNQLESALEAFLSSRLAAQNRQPFGQCHDCRYFMRNHPDGNPHFCRLLEERLDDLDAMAICFEQQPAQPN